MTVALSLSLLTGGCEHTPTTRSLGADSILPVAARQAVSPSRCRPTESVIRPVGPSQSGAVVLARAGDRDLAIVADRDDEAVIVVDAHRGLEVSRLELGAAVEHVMVAPDGRILASLAERDQVVVLAWDSDPEAEGLVARCSTTVPGEPSGMAMRGDRLLVASRWSAELNELDAETLTLRRTLPLDRDPYAVAFVGAEQALVTHVVGGRVSRIGLGDGRVEALEASRNDTKGGGSFSKEPLPMWKSSKMKKRPKKIWASRTVDAHRVATQAYSVAVGSDGRAFIPASLADGSESPIATGYGGGGGRIRTHAGVTLEVHSAGVTVPTGDARTVGRDCQLPRAVALDDEEGLLYVACLGVDAVHVYDQRSKLPDLLFARVTVPPGPTGLALDVERRRLLVWSQFSGSLAALDLPTREAWQQSDQAMVDVPTKVAETAELKRHRPLAPAVARGRAIFHEAGPKRRIASDGRACASCHPDGRDDAISWATVEGPRQTPILMARLEGTAPFGWNGEKEDVQAHLDRTLTRLRGVGLSLEERQDVLAYIHAMTPPRTSLTEHHALVARGAELYADEAVGCASCHPTSAGTSDGLTHELSPRNPRDRAIEFDTPSLRFVGQSAPYFHDGRYETLDALLADAESTMGHSASLSAGDRRALKTFLQTL